ncbi:MAG: Spo0E family sporulation regulatory protein-aspartic acid phosphatase [Halanaerobiales bacterium]
MVIKKVLNEENLSKKIEKIRSELQNMVTDASHGFDNEKIIKKSQELDKLINLYNSQK